MNAIKQYLAEIGRRGGQKSKRKLTKAQARAMVRARTAKRAALRPNIFFHDGKRLADFDSNDDDRPTHWAPMIEPPKETDFHYAGSDALGARAATTREGH